MIKMTTMSEVQRARKSQCCAFSGEMLRRRVSEPCPAPSTNSTCRRLITGNTALKGKLYSRKAIYSLSLIRGMSDIMAVGGGLERRRNFWEKHSMNTAPPEPLLELVFPKGSRRWPACSSLGPGSRKA